MLTGRLCCAQLFNFETGLSSPVRDEILAGVSTVTGSPDDIQPAPFVWITPVKIPRLRWIIVEQKAVLSRVGADFLCDLG